MSLLRLFTTRTSSKGKNAPRRSSLRLSCNRMAWQSHPAILKTPHPSRTRNKSASPSLSHAFSLLPIGTSLTRRPSREKKNEAPSDRDGEKSLLPTNEKKGQLQTLKAHRERERERGRKGSAITGRLIRSRVREEGEESHFPFFRHALRLARMSGNRSSYCSRSIECNNVRASGLRVW